MDDDTSVGDFPAKLGCLGGWSDTSLLMTGLLASWVLFPFWPVQFIVEGPMLSLLYSRNSKLRHAAFWLSSTVVVVLGTMLSTVIGYFIGTVKVYDTFDGQYGENIGGFSTRYRCSRGSSNEGDIGMPSMMLIDLTNTVAFKALYAMFGPAKHTYHGALPTRLDILSWINAGSGQTVPASSLATGKITVAGTSYNIPAGVAAAVFYREEYHAPSAAIIADARQATHVRVVLYQSQCLVIMAPSPSKIIVTLVEADSGKFIAQDLFDLTSETQRSWKLQHP